MTDRFTYKNRPPESDPEVSPEEDYKADLTPVEDPIKTEVIKRMHRAGKKWTHIERSKVMLDVSTMLLRGNSVRQIIEIMVDETEEDDQKYISEHTIRTLVKAVEDEWKTRSVDMIDKVKSRELARLDLIENEAWDAWERSKQLKAKDQVNSEVEVDRTTKQQKRTPRVTRTIKETSNGDPRYLDIVFKCIDKRIRLYGLAEIQSSESPVIEDDRNDLASRLDKYAGLFSGSTVTVERVTISEHHSDEPVDSQRSSPETSRILDTTGSVR